MSIQHENLPTYSRWLTEEVFKLIDMVRSDEAIYNPRHKYYFCRPYVENFWREVDLRLRKNLGASLAKWTNLRISFRREYTNFQEEKIPPCWSYFDKMYFLHPYLRNSKKPPVPKEVDSHIQEALAHINSINYKPLKQATTVSPSNDYVDQYLSYCDDDPHPSPGVDDIIEEEDDQNQTSNPESIKNEIKSEGENENEIVTNDNTQSVEKYKDIIVELSDDATTAPDSPPVSKRKSPIADNPNRSLFKRCRTEPSVIASSSNISMVRPLAMTPVASEHHSSAGPFHVSLTNRTAGGAGSPTRRTSDLCECKSDSDAMFLMSLLPDIRKLHGRDRGKIKIAFQNILQEFLYPE